MRRTVPALLTVVLAVLGGLSVLLRRLASRPPSVADREALPPGSTSVTTEDGVRLHVEVEEADSDLTVVLVHGFTARLGEFELQRDALRRAGVRAVLYDHRGHGRSAWGPPRAATTAQLGRDLAVVLDEVVPPGPVVLLGHSMGGMTVMALARQRPELFGPRVAGVLLLATSAGELVHTGVVGSGVRVLRRLRLLGAYLWWLRLLSPVLERFRRRGTVAGRAFTRRYLFGRDDADDPALVTEVQRMLEETPLTVSAAFWATFVSHDELASLQALRGVPVTVVCGTHDRLTPLAHSRRIAAVLPDAELVVVPGAGHSVNVTRYQVVDDALLGLVERVRARAAA
ncbi:MAG TPA: alpha/beta hydrolase [Mycobacteriales bacterium]|nr:alpha/beta hydrolase [Mycobacteriales bacterium]